MNIRMYTYILLSVIGFSAGNVIANEDLDQKEAHVEGVENVVAIEAQVAQEAELRAQCDKETKACLQSIETSYKHLEDGMDIIRQVEACEETLTELSDAILNAESMEEVQELRERVDQVRSTMQELERKAKRWSE